MHHTNNPIIKHKARLLNLAEELGNVSKACKIMGVSRDTFYRYQELAEEGGIDALINQSRRVPNLKNRADEATERAVVNYAVEFPAHGQHRTSNELRKKGVFISGSGVRSIWQRHNLENFRKRLKALEEKVAREGIVLTDAQIAALEKKALDDEACGEIETAHPGYLGSQDTFYVGNLKGVGRIYCQQRLKKVGLPQLGWNPFKPEGSSPDASVTRTRHVRTFAASAFSGDSHAPRLHRYSICW